MTHILGMGVPMAWDSIELWIKLHILSKEFDYLGHVITQEGITPCQKKIEAELVREDRSKMGYRVLHLEKCMV
jgi:hypothetical protein